MVTVAFSHVIFPVFLRLDSQSSDLLQGSFELPFVITLAELSRRLYSLLVVNLIKGIVESYKKLH